MPNPFDIYDTDVAVADEPRQTKKPNPFDVFDKKPAGNPFDVFDKVAAPSNIPQETALAERTPSGQPIYDRTAEGMPILREVAGVTATGKQLPIETPEQAAAVEKLKQEQYWRIAGQQAPPVTTPSTAGEIASEKMKGAADYLTSSPFFAGLLTAPQLAARELKKVYEEAASGKLQPFEAGVRSGLNLLGVTLPVMAPLFYVAAPLLEGIGFNEVIHKGEAFAAEQLQKPEAVLFLSQFGINRPLTKGEAESVAALGSLAAQVAVFHKAGEYFGKSAKAKAPAEVRPEPITQAVDDVSQAIVDRGNALRESPEYKQYAAPAEKPAIITGKKPSIQPSGLVDESGQPIPSQAQREAQAAITIAREAQSRTVFSENIPNLARTKEELRLSGVPQADIEKMGFRELRQEWTSRKNQAGGITRETTIPTGEAGAFPFVPKEPTAKVEPTIIAPTGYTGGTGARTPEFEARLQEAVKTIVETKVEPEKPLELPPSFRKELIRRLGGPEAKTAAGIAGELTDEDLARVAEVRGVATGSLDEAPASQGGDINVRGAANAEQIRRFQEEGKIPAPEKAPEAAPTPAEPAPLQTISDEALTKAIASARFGVEKSSGQAKDILQRRFDDLTAEQSRRGLTPREPQAARTGAAKGGRPPKYAGLNDFEYPALSQIGKGSITPEWTIDRQSGKVRLAGEYENIDPYLLDLSGKPKPEDFTGGRTIVGKGKVGLDEQAAMLGFPDTETFRQQIIQDTENFNKHGKDLWDSQERAAMEQFTEEGLANEQITSVSDRTPEEITKLEPAITALEDQKGSARTPEELERVVRDADNLIAQSTEVKAVTPLRQQYNELLSKRLSGSGFENDPQSPVYRNSSQDAFNELKKITGRKDLTFFDLDKPTEVKGKPEEKQLNAFKGTGEPAYQAKVPEPPKQRETKGTEGTPLFEKEKKASTQENIFSGEKAVDAAKKAGASPGDLLSIGSLVAHQAVDFLPVDDDTKKKLKTLFGITGVVGIAAMGVPTFYSKLRKFISERMPNAMTAEALRGMISKGEVKPEEVKWTGLDDFIEQNKRKKVTKAEVEVFLKQNEVRVNEVVKGGGTKEQQMARVKAKVDAAIHRRQEIALSLKTDNTYVSGQPPRWMYKDASGKVKDVPKVLAAELDEAQDSIRTWEKMYNEGEWDDLTHNQGPDETKFSQYTLPGAKEGSYRELLLTLPDVPAKAEKFRAEMKDKYGRGWELNMSKEEHGKFSQLNLDIIEGEHGFKSPHFDEANILAHVRFNERADAQGKKVLFIEEIQSDWAQKGKREGFQTANIAALPEGYEIKRRENVRGTFIEGFSIFDKESGKDITPNTKGFATEEAALKNALFLFNSQDFARGVPDMPFKKTWPEVSMKRMIRWAADNGYDKVAWTTGEQQAARYDLSKQVEQITYFKNGKGSPYGSEGTFNIHVDAVDGENTIRKNGLNPQQVEELVGKEIAKKIVENLGTNTEGKWYARDMYEYAGNLKGEGLKVGGEGMKGFYDQILPSIANKIGKKFGAKVDKTQLPPTRDVRYLETGMQRIEGVNQPVHSLDITPSMKQGVQREGFPLFSIASLAAQTVPIDQLPVSDETKKKLKALQIALGVAGIIGIAKGLSPKGLEALKEIESYVKGKGITLNEGIRRFIKSDEGKALGEKDVRVLGKIAGEGTANKVAEQIAKAGETTTEPVKQVQHEAVKQAQASLFNDPALQKVNAEAQRQAGMSIEPAKLKTSLAEETVQKVFDTVKNLGIRPKSQDKILAQVLDTGNVLVARNGKGGSELYDKGVDATNLFREYLNTANGFLEEARDARQSLPRSERLRVDQRIVSALENREKANEILQSPAEKKYYEMIENLYDFFRKEMEKKGLPTRDDYFTRTRKADALTEMLDNADNYNIEHPETSPLFKLNDILTGKSDSPFFKKRTNAMFDYAKSPLDVARRYTNSVGRALSMNEFLDYYFTRFLGDIPQSIKAQSPHGADVSFATRYAHDVARPEYMFGTVNRWIRSGMNNFYKNALNWNVGAAIQNNLQKQFSKIHISKEAAKLSSELYSGRKNLSGNTLRALEQMSKDKSVLLEQEERQAIKPEGSKTSWNLFNAKVEEIEPFKAAEKTNWDSSEIDGLSQQAFRIPEFRQALASGKTSVEALEQVLSDPQNFKNAVRSGKRLAEATQLLSTVAAKPEIFRTLSRTALYPIGMFKRFKSGQLENLIRTTFFQEGATGQRALSILKRGIDEEITPVEHLRAVEFIRKNVEAAHKQVLKGTIDSDVPKETWQQFVIDLKTQEKELNGVLKEIEPLPGKARVGLHWARYFAMQFAFNTTYSVLADVLLPEKDDKRTPLERAITSSLYNTIPFYAELQNPSRLISTALVPDFQYNNIRSKAQGYVRWGFNVIPYAGMVDRLVGRRISDSVVDLIAPKKEKSVHSF